MALAETAKLVVDLSLAGNFQSGISKATKSLNGLNSTLTNTEGRAFKAGQQIGTGIKRSALILTAAVGATIPLLISMAKEGQKAADVQVIFAKAIENSGKITAANVTALKAQEEALLRLGGVDDELIKSEQTRLIQMGLTGDQILKLTPLILDFSKATGIDLLTATKLAGKATQGNIGALSRYGVQIDKTKAKVDPFAATVDALNKKFGGTTQALSGQLDTKLGVLREELANVREEAGIKLLPVFTRIVDVVGTRLVPAFGKLIDAILPEAIARLNKFADFLDKGGGANAINGIVDTIKSVLPAIRSGAEITARVIGTAVNLFKSLPPEIQSLAVAGLAVNKLTGGLVTNVAGGIVGAILGQLKSAVVNVTGAVVNVNGVPGGGGGPPLPGGPAAQEGESLLSKVGKIFQFLGLAGATLKVSSDLAPGAAASDQKLLDAIHGIGSPGHPLTVAASGLSNPILDRGGRETGVGGSLQGKLRDDKLSLAQLLRGITAEFKGALATLLHSTDPQKIANAVKSLESVMVANGHGSVEQTRQTISALSAQLKRTHDPTLQAALRGAITDLKNKIPGREYAARALAKADKIIHGTQPLSAKIAGLQSIEKDLANHKLPGQTRALAAKIDALKRQQAIKQQQTTQAIKDKDLSVKVTVPVTNKTIVNTRQVFESARTYSNFYNFGNGVRGG